jgi:hypothetical protein
VTQVYAASLQLIKMDMLMVLFDPNLNGMSGLRHKPSCMYKGCCKCLMLLGPSHPSWQDENGYFPRWEAHSPDVVMES